MNLDHFERLQDKIKDLRFRSFGGASIKLHRSIYKVRLNLANLIVSLLLPVLFTLLLLFFLDEIVNFWRVLFVFCLEKIDAHATVYAHPIDFGRYVLWLSYPDMYAGAPSTSIWWSTLTACAIMFVSTYFIPPDRYLPLVYIVRACLLIQLTSVVYFYFIPAQFPYDLPNYLGNSLVMSLLFIFMVPWLLGLTYYVFDFSLMQKIFLTCVIVGYFLVVFPLQYLLHVYLLQYISLLFLPLFYLVFGAFIDVMMFVAFYSWGMSWRWQGINTE